MALPRPRRRLVGVSLKMYFDIPTTRSYIQGLASLSHSVASEDIDIFVIPDFLFLMKAADILRGTSIKLGAQDTHWEDAGAFTGEVSPVSLQQIGCMFVEIGHAERRKLFAETDESVAKKAVAAERNGIVPLVCVGEKTRGEVRDAVAQCTPQIEPVLSATKGEIVLAYEPVWAIGQSEPASPEYVVAVARELRKLCGDRDVRILYGGSAGPGLFEKLASGVDGLFLGRFAHDLNAFRETIAEVAL
jgi:triosephosphate isomerase